MAVRCHNFFNTANIWALLRIGRITGEEQQVSTKTAGILCSGLADQIPI